MKKLSLLFLALLTSILQLSAQAVGTWTYYPYYGETTTVVKGGSSIIYAVVSENLLAYNPSDGSVTEYNKTNALSDTHISDIAWCLSASKLIIIYENSNIDLMDTNGSVVNISDLYSKSMTADKTINDIYVDGSIAYLSTGFGVIKLNVQDAYISDTYNLGFNVNHSYIDGDYLYASSSTNGLYRASLSSSNMVDKKEWTRVGEYTKKDRIVDAELLETITPYIPNGPSTNQFYAITYSQNCLYGVPGLYIAGESESDTPGEVNQLSSDGDWITYENNLKSTTGYDYVDNYCIAVDPTDNNHVFVGGRCGLYEFYEGKLQKAYNQQNSPLKGVQMTSTQVLGNDYVIIAGLAFDDNGSLWILNSLAKDVNIVELKKDGTFAEHYQQQLVVNSLESRNLSAAFFDSKGLLWFVNNQYQNSLLACYNTTTDQLTVYNSPLITEDGLSLSAKIHHVAEDADGNIWVATDKGPLVLTNSALYNGESTFVQPKVPRNDGTNYADYLLNGVDVTAIEVDGAGRLWMGTNGLGVYLIDKDGTTQLQHFTQSNSLLISDYITSISIDGTNGRVFFASMNGLCSYITDAISPSSEMTKQNVWAYPNPVTPDYTGLVTIVGLTSDADVKILTTSGGLVAEGRSQGGMFTWDCKDKQGRRVASGVYFVATATSDGKRGTVCKIAVIN